MDLTLDGFLDGRMRAWQPKDGYRAAVDAVLLAAACPAKPGQSVLELGCGAGVATLCLAARVPDLALIGVEVQEDYATLAHRNAQENGVALDVVTADLTDLPDPWRHQCYDHVIANPPYFQTGTEAPDAGRARARHEATPLSDWVDTAARRLAPKGWLTIILPADRLPDLLAELGAKFADIHVKPIAPRHARPARRVVVKARKSAAGPFRLCPPLVLHAAKSHEKDGEDHSEDAISILRKGAALCWD